MRKDIYGNRRSTSSMGINELYDELAFEDRYCGELAVDSPITLLERSDHCGWYQTSGTITRMSDKAVLVEAGAKSGWYTKTALNIIPGPEGRVVCKIARWFKR